MELISLHIKIPVEMKKYLKHMATDEDTTIMEYVTKLIEKDMKENNDD